MKKKYVICLLYAYLLLNIFYSSHKYLYNIKIILNAPFANKDYKLKIHYGDYYYLFFKIKRIATRHRIKKIFVSSDVVDIIRYPYLMSAFLFPISIYWNSSVERCSNTILIVCKKLPKRGEQLFIRKSWDIIWQGNKIKLVEIGKCQ